MKAYISAIVLASTVAFADCNKKQENIISNITEGVQSKAKTICLDGVLLYKDTTIKNKFIIVTNEMETAVCSYDGELTCQPLDVQSIKNGYINTFIKNSL